MIAHTLPRHTVACRDRDFAEWHGGCTHALVWAILVDTDGVREAVGDARGRLSGLLLPRYDRQPHVTLAYAGLMPAAGSTPIEEPVDATRLIQAVDALRASGTRPFGLRVSGWGSFEMVPYLAVDAPELHTAHRALHPNADSTSYVPHVTVGHYAESRPMDDVAARLDPWARGPIDVEVREITLLAYETRDIAGPLTVVGILSLDDGAWTAHAELQGLPPIG